MKLLNLVIMLLGIAVVVSCGKEQDKTNPEIKFIEPDDKDTITIGTDSLHVEFKMTDNEVLSNYTYVIKDTFNRKYYQGGQFIEGKEFTHHGHVIFGGFSGLQMLTLTVQAYDRSYNTVQASRTFYIQP